MSVDLILFQFVYVIFVRMSALEVGSIGIIARGYGAKIVRYSGIIAASTGPVSWYVLMERLRIIS